MVEYVLAANAANAVTDQGVSTAMERPAQKLVEVGDKGLEKRRR